MTSTSDILILLKTPIDEAAAEGVKNAIYQVTTTATVSFKPDPGKVFLVRFTPAQDHPDTILAAVRDAGWEATMAGG